jgi:hypothetical protein
MPQLHHALGNALAVEVLELFDQVEVLQQERGEFWLSATGMPDAVARRGVFNSTHKV